MTAKSPKASSAVCHACGYTWSPRIPLPRKCPACFAEWPLGRDESRFAPPAYTAATDEAPS